jgi:drug/metabolite transporter (DMT)-like permease
MAVYFKLVLATIFRGGTFVAARVIAQEMGPFSASFLRFFAATLFLVALILRITRGQISNLSPVFGPSPRSKSRSMQEERC